MRTISALLVLSSIGVAAEPAITVLPESIQLSTNVSFDEQGAFKRSQSQLRLQVKIVPPAGTQLAASRGVRVGEATSDRGESLVPKGAERGSANGEQAFNEWARERNDYDVWLTLANPSQPITSIRTLSGTITVAVATGAAKQATIAPVKEWLGKPAALEAINEEVTLERKSEGTTLRGSRALFDRLQKVTFTDAAGHEIKVNGWGGGSENDEYYRTWSIQAPDDGGITLQFLPELKDREVPFAFTDLPLKAAAAERKPAAKVKVTDVPTEKAEKPKADGVKDPNAKAGGF